MSLKRYVDRERERERTCSVRVGPALWTDGEKEEYAFKNLLFKR